MKPKEDYKGEYLEEKEKICKICGCLMYYNEILKMWCCEFCDNEEE
jgi:hypothetical protein